MKVSDTDLDPVEARSGYFGRNQVHLHPKDFDFMMTLKLNLIFLVGNTRSRLLPCQTFLHSVNTDIACHSDILYMALGQTRLWIWPEDRLQLHMGRKIYKGTRKRCTVEK